MTRRRSLLALVGLAAGTLVLGAWSSSRGASAAAAGAPRLAVARLQYDGDDWYANPSSLPNLIRAIRERTTLAVDPREVRTTLLDDRLWDYPFLHLTGHGNIKFTDAEAANLRRWLDARRVALQHVFDGWVFGTTMARLR